jgi:hypothetical protein
METNCCELGLWCLTPLSTIFQLYRGSLFYWREKTTDLEQVTDKLVVLFRPTVVILSHFVKSQIPGPWSKIKCNSFSYFVKQVVFPKEENADEMVNTHTQHLSMICKMCIRRDRQITNDWSSFCLRDFNNFLSLFDIRRKYSINKNFDVL